jgi:hypothetical protein
MTGTVEAFQNIEADAYYEGPVKAETMKEFEIGLALLKKQADGLRMDVREKDITALQLHMYGKALLKGECFDRAITLQKTSGSKTNIAQSVKNCVEVNLNYKPSPAKLANDARGYCHLTLAYWTREHRPYPFLKIEDVSPSPPNFIGIRACYEDPKHDFGDRQTKPPM